jgi:hypothetical protein
MDAMFAGDIVQFARQRAIHPGRQNQRSAALDAASHFEREAQFFDRQRDHGQIGARMGQIGQRARHAHIEIGHGTLEAALFQLGAD